MTEIVSRRRALGGLAAGAGGLLLAGCDRVAKTTTARSLFTGAEALTYRANRLLTARDALAPEYGAGDISPVFRSNGTAMPGGGDYAALLANRFRDWRLQVTGLVARPLSLSLDQIGRLQRRTQTTRHDCVEGWSAIGRWTGTPLGPLLAAAGLSGAARYIVFHCYDLIGGTPYYESIDLVDAFHPQTILAYALNGHLLPVPNGAPLRLRIERQLGYKQAKYIHTIEAVASLAAIGAGKGGYWEDVGDYAWYAGI
ncbi:molybdopterin-dependent oxidoreductase [Sphingomonas nostoxanthinifaciens]|uniref:molybdopterin-dependent oxidoreductase n=1 Tax=Sphingomonas nostoxanthinifaciens TaxID=2872652 RepID=UPI001CC1C3C1|nr:molybdopterin-dependent oxidoreductase [Sphingomonas nostoxanthinifaciens]UAK24488.1 molybdopterin-dependent oxidoreductase [Sphingomonas nostoxanthinifaciens]